MENHVKIYSGNEIEILAIKDLLEQNHIPYIIRDDIHSGITAGFGTIDQAVHIFVFESDSEKAKSLLQK